MRLTTYSNFMPFINNLISSARDKNAREFGNRLNVEADIVRRNIDASDSRQAEIEIQKAAAQGARSDIDLDQWNTIVKSGTSQDDYVQKYLQGQDGRDFQNPNALSPTAIMIAIGAFAIIFLVIVVLLITKSKPDEK